MLFVVLLCISLVGDVCCCWLGVYCVVVIGGVVCWMGLEVVLYLCKCLL